MTSIILTPDSFILKGYANYQISLTYYALFQHLLQADDHHIKG